MIYHAVTTGLVPVERSLAGYSAKKGLARSSWPMSAPPGQARRSREISFHVLPKCSYNRRTGRALTPWGSAHGVCRLLCRSRHPRANRSGSDHLRLRHRRSQPHGQARFFGKRLAAAGAGRLAARGGRDPAVSIARPAVINVYVEHTNSLSRGEPGHKGQISAGPLHSLTGRSVRAEKSARASRRTLACVCRLRRG